MAVEEEYTDFLQNVEFAITSVHREQPKLLDLDVIEALDALIRGYDLEAQGRSWPTVQLSSRAASVVERCKEVCEWRLGRGPMPGASSRSGRDPRPSPIAIAAIVQCLKRLRKSARLWSERGGRQGYLEYIQQFLP